MSQIIKFNIGGTRYEVSQSLLQSYPDTMLAKSAEKQWHKDPNEEIFIDRNGLRFQYVLDYLRDGKVSLPPTVTKSSLISDLLYYGVENILEDKINDDLVRGAAYGKAFSGAKAVADQWIQAVENHENTASILYDCYSIYSSFIRDARRGEYSPSYSFVRKKDHYHVNRPRGWKGSSAQQLNPFLSQMGLVVVSIDYICDYVNLKTVDP